MRIKNIYSIFFCLLIMTIFIYGVLSVAAQESKIIQTYGEAEISAQPDLAKISLSIETRDQSAKVAVEKNAKLANTVFEALIDFGLTENEVKTSSYRLNSYREWQKEGSTAEKEVIYYLVVNEIVLSVSRLDEVGKLIDLAVQAGANNINYINFELMDPQELMLQALTMATRQAQQKAESIAQGAGVKISELFSIKEERTTYAPYRAQEAMLSRAMAGGPSPTPISPDEVIVRATVIAEFSF
ncbi:MAG TPA: SIMPL domain-containing protein [Atribacterota bacterium]|nr:SIMPL domain-containing protein [Atribacterota bacterium]